MQNFVMNVETLPMPIREIIHANKVSVQEHEGNIVLVPIRDMAREQKAKMSRKDMFGCMRGQFKMADDFDAPLDDFKEYME